MTEVAKKKPINSRAKGARAERELKNLLKDSFPEYLDDFRRNQDQSERGGHDIIGLPGYAPECKAVADFHLPGYWRQTVTQATTVKLIPVLFRKVPLKGWEVYLHLKHVVPGLFDAISVDAVPYVCVMSYEAFVKIARQESGLV